MPALPPPLPRPLRHARLPPPCPHPSVMPALPLHHSYAPSVIPAKAGIHATPNTRPQPHTPDGPPHRPHKRSGRLGAVEHPTCAPTPLRHARTPPPSLLRPLRHSCEGRNPCDPQHPPAAPSPRRPTAPSAQAIGPSRRRRTSNLRPHAPPSCPHSSSITPTPPPSFLRRQESMRPPTPARSPIPPTAHRTVRTSDRAVSPPSNIQPAPHATQPTWIPAYAGLTEERCRTALSAAPTPREPHN